MSLRPVPYQPIFFLVTALITIDICRIGVTLDEFGIRYGRLDGTMSRPDRTRAMDDFKSDPQCEILLVSLRAGGVGLNLTCAQRVYLMVSPLALDLSSFGGAELNLST